MAVAGVEPGDGASIVLGGELGHRAFADTERVQRVGQDRLGQGYRWLLLTCALGRTQRESHGWPHPYVDPTSYFTAHHAAGGTPDHPALQALTWQMPRRTPPGALILLHLASALLTEASLWHIVRRHDRQG